MEKQKNATKRMPFLRPLTITPKSKYINYFDLRPFMETISLSLLPVTT